MEVHLPIQAPSPQVAWAGVIKDFWHWIRQAAKPRRARRLRVGETLSLGERRFLAVIEFDHQEFLVGGSGNSLVLLARLQDGRVMQETADGIRGAGHVTRDFGLRIRGSGKTRISDTRSSESNGTWKSSPELRDPRPVSRTPSTD